MTGLRIGVLGAAGRMGRMIVRIIEETGGVVLGAEVRATAELDGALSSVDVMIDFSAPGATCALLPLAAQQGVALVIGTTGLDKMAMEAVASAARQVPVVRSANMSLGVNVLVGLLRRASRALPDFDVEIAELHHRLKKDAPSGTALMMEEAIASERGLDPAAVLCSGRQGQVGARSREEIGVLALRGGDVVGEHTAYFLGPGERVEIAHRATNREIFARGAVRAAQWVCGKPPGHYDMLDVLGLRS